MSKYILFQFSHFNSKISKNLTFYATFLPAAHLLYIMRDNMLLEVAHAKQRR